MWRKRCALLRCVGTSCTGALWAGRIGKSNFGLYRSIAGDFGAFWEEWVLCNDLWKLRNCAFESWICKRGRVSEKRGERNLWEHTKTEKRDFRSRIVKMLLWDLRESDAKRAISRICRSCGSRSCWAWLRVSRVWRHVVKGSWFWTGILSLAYGERLWKSRSKDAGSIWGAPEGFYGLSGTEYFKARRRTCGSAKYSWILWRVYRKRCMEWDGRRKTCHGSEWGDVWWPIGRIFGNSGTTAKWNAICCLETKTCKCRCADSTSRAV